MPPGELAAYRADPVWPVRVATAADDRARARGRDGPGGVGLAALAAVRQPVLQILGGESLPVFARRPSPSTSGSPTDGSSVIAGARHAAHHTHPAAFVAAVLGDSA